MRQLNTTLLFLVMGILIFSVSDSLHNTVKGIHLYPYHQSDSYSENLSSDSIKPGLVDHHVHLFSPKDRRYLERNVKKIDTLPPLGIKQYLAVMKKSNVEKASVLSTAYFFSKQGKTSKQDSQTVYLSNRDG